MKTMHTCYFESVSSSEHFQFYLDVRSLILLLFQEVAVFCARRPRRFTAIRSLREDQAFLKNYKDEQDLT